MRFGFVGVGRAARLYHLPAVKRLAGATAVGGADASPEQRASWEERETGVPAFESLDELIETAKPDVAVVATPPQSHVELLTQALDAGIHVISEKPLATSVDEIDRILAAAATAGRGVAVNHQYREQPIFRAIREGVASREFGRLAFCQVWQLMDLAPWNEPTPWRASMANRVLLEGGVHLVDLLLGIFGEAPEGVYASHSSGFHEDPEADAVHLVTVDFPGGRLGQIAIDRLCQGGTRYMELRADCERASLRASLGGRMLAQIGMKRAERPGVRLDIGLGGLAWSEQGTRRKVLARSGRDVNVQATTDLFRGIVDAFREGREPPSSGREAREVLAVIEGAYESAETGVRVDLTARRAVTAA